MTDDIVQLIDITDHVICHEDFLLIVEGQCVPWSSNELPFLI
jgi:hypothetical protein